jgi:uncharacterized protein (TIGR03032 family)
VLDSGSGFLGHIGLGAGHFQPLAFCPGFLRGLAFVGDYAIVGLSRPRRDGTFSGLKLDENLRERDAEPRSGLHIINLNTGDVEEWLRFEGDVQELYDVVVLQGARRPMLLGFQTDDIQRTYSIEDDPETPQ